MNNNNAINKAKEIYLSINSYSNPSTMNDIEREWIINKIAEGLTEYLDTEVINLMNDMAMDNMFNDTYRD